MTRSRLRGFGCAVSASVLLFASPSFAQQAAPTPVAPALGSRSGVAAAASQKRLASQLLDNTPPSEAVRSVSAEKHQPPRLSWSGRVFAGNVLTRQRLAGATFWRSKQQVSSARVGLKYEGQEGMSAVIKLEFDKGTPKLKDGYVRLNGFSSLRLQAGRFKQPMSIIGLAGRWDLPSIERGLLDSVSVEGQSLPFVGGRGDGVQLQYQPLASKKVRLSASIFQNSLGTGTASLDASKHFSQDVYLRGTLTPFRELTVSSSLALFGYLAKTGDSQSFAHAPVASFEVAYQPRWLRLWAEGFVGKSMFAKIDGSTSGNFVGARVLVAANIKTGTPRRLRPFVGMSYFDPRLSEAGDANTEVQVGTSLAFAKTWRLQVELTQGFAQGDLSPAIEGTAFRLQLGARFKE